MVSLWRVKSAVIEARIARSKGAGRKFWTIAATPRNAIDYFDGEWQSNLSEVDAALPRVGSGLFVSDSRPRDAAAALGSNGRLDGMSVLDLGSLEGAHCYQMERLGAARVTGIEGNARNFLRCLMVKNIFALDRTTFLLGDGARFLESHDEQFDMILACGILYHMKDPVDLIRAMCAKTRKIFIWTQYYRPEYHFGERTKSTPKRKPYSRDGLALDVYEVVYRNRLRRPFIGGIHPTACLMTFDGIVATLRHYGFDAIDIIKDRPTGGLGPELTLAATKA